MKKRLKLDALKVESFITKEESHKVIGGASIYSDCAACSSRCSGGSGGPGPLSERNCVM